VGETDRAGWADGRGWFLASGLSLAMLGVAALMPTRATSAMAATAVGVGLWTWLGRRPTRRYRYWLWLPVIVLCGGMQGLNVTLARNAWLAGGEPLPLSVEALGQTRPKLPRRVTLSGYVPADLAYGVDSQLKFGGNRYGNGKITQTYHHRWQGLVPQGWRAGEGVSVVVTQGFSARQRVNRQAVTGMLYADPYRPGDWPIPDGKLIGGLVQAPFPLANGVYVLETDRDLPALWEELGSMLAANMLIVACWLTGYWYFRRQGTAPAAGDG
jgi:hypothetical protein